MEREVDSLLIRKRFESLLNLLARKKNGDRECPRSDTVEVSATIDSADLSRGKIASVARRRRQQSERG